MQYQVLQLVRVNGLCDVFFAMVGIINRFTLNLTWWRGFDFACPEYLCFALLYGVVRCFSNHKGLLVLSYLIEGLLYFRYRYFLVAFTCFSIGILLT